MKKIFYAVSAALLVLALVAPSIADTIRLKDGSVIRGQVIGFKDQQFVILIGAGAKGRRSRTTVYVEDIESIEFDAATTSAAAVLANEDLSSSNSTEPVSQPPRTQPSPSSTNSRTNNPSTSGASPTFFTIKVAVRADSANNGWTNSGLVVRKGQRLKISSSGRVSLGKGRFSTPIGVATIADNDKLVRNEATGALIAVIGDDNDDFILVGGRRDFVAQRDGVLFLGVNEGDLKDNTGAYDIVIEAEAGSAPR
ncbi:MAG: hypothetical protein ACR2G5_12330 [Pyrinomonadaceae bacterium]